MSKYSVRMLSRRCDIDSFVAEWQQWLKCQSERHIENHPNWVLASVDNSQQEDHVLVAVLYEGQQIACVAPFQVFNQPWRCQLGYRTIINFPMVLADLCGDTLAVPPLPEAREALWRAIADCAVPYNFIFLECLPQNSALWRAIHESPIIRKRFWIYKPTGITQRHRIHLTGSFENYLEKFDRERRRKLKQELNRLERACDGDFIFERITTADQVPDFLRAVEKVSAASWQGSQLGLVLHSTLDQVRTLQSYAAMGWLRCYLIRTSQIPIAFGIGWQCDEDQTYYWEYTGFDPAWKARSPGKVLLLRMIEDLCLYEPKKWFDFRRGDSEYKQFFGNHTFPEANIYLIRKSVYNGLAVGTQSMFVTFATIVRKALDLLGLRKKVRYFLRNRSKIDNPTNPS